ncbi:cytochrome P450 2G1-like [Alligator sinensis]|uniref:Cytochrome P450 2G1-like n=1 Tax=Alligator sinensis TaxID=38654 RepID=A0A3Q0HED9_ALLSI|nr:cytochrome P450 2G1-like [Alligator sinensis]
MELGDGAILLPAAGTTYLIFWERKWWQCPGKLPPGPMLLQFLSHILQLKQRGFNKLLMKASLLLANGARWKQLRRFSASTLRNFGMGKKSIEERIQEESQYLVEEMGNTKGSPFNPTLAITHSIANVICSIVFGNRFDYKDQKFLNLMGSINNAFLDMSKTSSMPSQSPIPSADSGPPTGSMRCFRGSCNTYPAHTIGLITTTRPYKRVRINQQSLDPSCPRDFIDSFLIRMEEEKQNPQSEFSTRNLVDTAIQLFFAGTETTSSTLRFGLLFLVKYPEVQDKVHEEIDRVIGRTHSPAMNDRGRMPYTNAVIHEIQRLANILPFGVPRKVTCDTRFRGYLLPKDTDVCIALGIILQDPKYFKDPKSFHPEHFLAEEGHFKKNDSFLPFGTGKRVCLGKSLALMELFLMLTTILQRFTLKSPKEPQEIDLTPKVNGSGIVPPSYELYALPREEGLHDST